jgi:hypothetical protein
MPKKTRAEAAPKAKAKPKPKAAAKAKAKPHPKPAPAVSAPPKVEDLRIEERFPERLPVALHVQSDGGEVEHGATTIDISIFGLQVETTGKLEPGQMVRIPTFGNCIVVWVRTVGPDRPYQAGLKMVR